MPDGPSIDKPISKWAVRHLEIQAYLLQTMIEVVVGLPKMDQCEHGKLRKRMRRHTHR